MHFYLRGAATHALGDQELGTVANMHQVPVFGAQSDARVARALGGLEVGGRLEQLVTLDAGRKCNKEKS